MAAQPFVSMPRFEHLEDGFGMGYPRPRLSWRFSYPGAVEPARDWAQVSYEAQLKSQASDTTESYVVSSGQSVLVPWPGPTLNSGDAVSVRVRCYSLGCSNPTEWSAWAAAECTLLSRNQWRAVPIATSLKYELENATLRPVRFRRTFSLPSNCRVTRARLYVTAHGLYQVRINSIRVGDHVLAPGWTIYHHRLGFQTFDVTSLLLLSEGNCIAAEVAEGWYAGRMGVRGGRSFNYGREVSILAQLEITLDGGDKVMVMTDEDWKCKPSAIQSSEIYNGEVCDMRYDDGNWNTADFDDQGWDMVQKVPFPSAKVFPSDYPPIRVTAFGLRHSGYGRIGTNSHHSPKR